MVPSQSFPSDSRSASSTTTDADDVRPDDDLENLVVTQAGCNNEKATSSPLPSTSGTGGGDAAGFGRRSAAGPDGRRWSDGSAVLTLSCTSRPSYCPTCDVPHLGGYDPRGARGRTRRRCALGRVHGPPSVSSGTVNGRLRKPEPARP